MTKRLVFRCVSVVSLPTSRGLASVGDLVSQMYRLNNQLPSTKPTLKFASNPNCAKPLLQEAFFYFKTYIPFLKEDI
jgi:hypothetical protein